MNHVGLECRFHLLSLKVILKYFARFLSDAWFGGMLCRTNGNTMSHQAIRSFAPTYSPQGKTFSQALVVRARHLLP